MNGHCHPIKETRFIKVAGLHAVLKHTLVSPAPQRPPPVKYFFQQREANSFQVYHVRHRRSLNCKA